MIMSQPLHDVQDRARRDRADSRGGLLWRHAGLCIVLLAYVAVAVLYGLTIPIFETPDANGHYAYVHELTEGRGLPVQGTPSGERVTGYVASHPPLYYALCAALTFWVEDDVDYEDWAWRNPFHTMGQPGATANKNRLVHTEAESFPWRGTPLTVHVARLASTALGLLAVVATYGTALELFSGRRWPALGAAALTAFSPMFVFTAARVSNDGAIAAFGSLVVWGGVRLAMRGLSRRGLALLGGVLGLAALSKLSGVTLAPALLVALLLNALRATRYALRPLFRKEHLVRLITDALILLGAATIVCGWWFARNVVLYGELMGVDAWLSHTATVRLEPIGFFDVIPQLEGLEMSYWALFGWFNVFAAPWMYRVWWVMVRLALLGLVVFVIEQRTEHRAPRPVWAGLSVVALSFLLVFGSVWRFIMIVLGSQGRYLMPAVAAISSLLILGLGTLLPRRWMPGLAILLGAGHLAITLVCLFGFILPAYSTPEPIQQGQLPAGMARLDLAFDTTPIQLLGGVIEAEEARPGEPLPVTVYWRALEEPDEDLFAFVKILGRDLEPIASVDAFPGGGTFPTTLWRPGVIYRDRYLLRPAVNAEVPAIVGLYAGIRRQGERPLPAAFPSGDAAPEILLLDTAPLRPAEPLSDEVIYSVGARIGDAITLVGYGIDPPLGPAGVLQCGQAFTVTLVWRAEGIPAGDYTAFVHLMDDGGSLVAQDDHPPLDGEYPTSSWMAGDVVHDVYRLTLDEDQPPCLCTLQVGLYDPAANVRVPAFDGLGRRFEGDAVVAGGVTVE
jgi:hypothetical protein